MDPLIQIHEIGLAGTLSDKLASLFQVVFSHSVTGISACSFA